MPRRSPKAGLRANPRADGRAAEDDIRIGPILPIPGLLREFGVDPAGVLAAAGLTEKQFNDPDSRISFDTVGAVLRESIAATHCAHFALLAGQRFQPAGLGIIYYSMRNASSLREALRIFTLHAHLHDRGAVPYLIEPDKGDAGLAYGIYHRGQFDTAPIYEGAMAIAATLCRSICGPDWQPVRVTFPHGPPADVTPYQQCFGAPLRFNTGHAAVFFAARWLDEPIKDRDPILQSLLLRVIAEREAAANRSFSEGVRRALRTMVVAGTASADRTAELFGMTRRTLHRRLEVEGTNFHTLVGETRYEVSRQLLKESDIPVGEIAALLRYSDATAFSRAFSGWSGASPRTWRSSQSRRRAAKR